MNDQDIAVLITCHNRKQKTLACLELLFGQVFPADIRLSVYLVDDNSTDGTAEAVMQQHPQVTILRGDGTLFWNGGMHKAFAAAILKDYDYYLWLNDDTLLYPNALLNLLQTAHQLVQQGEHKAIVVGSTQDPENGEWTYGGLTHASWWNPVSGSPVIPGNVPQPCIFMNGNCVLIPRVVVEVAGNLDPSFAHYLGDHDYGLRARKKGCTIWITPGYVGTCSGNLARRMIRLDSFNNQLERMHQPKGLAAGDAVLYSFKEWRVYTQRHAGLFWILFYLSPYRRLLRLAIRKKLQQFQRVAQHKA